MSFSFSPIHHISFFFLISQTDWIRYIYNIAATGEKLGVGSERDGECLSPFALASDGGFFPKVP
jgi:hypothetical protein